LTWSAILEEETCLLVVSALLSSPLSLAEIGIEMGYVSSEGNGP